MQDQPTPKPLSLFRKILVPQLAYRRFPPTLQEKRQGLKRDQGFFRKKPE